MHFEEIRLCSKRRQSHTSICKNSLSTDRIDEERSLASRGITQGSPHNVQLHFSRRSFPETIATGRTEQPTTSRIKYHE